MHSNGLKWVTIWRKAFSICTDVSFAQVGMSNNATKCLKARDSCKSSKRLAIVWIILVIKVMYSDFMCETSEMWL